MISSEICYIMQGMDGTFRAFEFKFNPKKSNAKCPLTFSTNYPEIPFSVITRDNYTAFITEEGEI